MVSVGVMIQKIHALVGTQDVNSDTSDFIEEMFAATQAGKATSGLSEGQLRWIESIHKRHYGQD